MHDFTTNYSFSVYNSFSLSCIFLTSAAFGALASTSIFVIFSSRMLCLCLFYSMNVFNFWMVFSWEFIVLSSLFLFSSNYVILLLFWLSSSSIAWINSFKSLSGFVSEAILFSSLLISASCSSITCSISWIFSVSAYDFSSLSMLFLASFRSNISYLLI